MKKLALPILLFSLVCCAQLVHAQSSSDPSGLGSASAGSAPSPASAPAVSSSAAAPTVPPAAVLQAAPTQAATRATSSRPTSPPAPLPAPAPAPITPAAAILPTGPIVPPPSVPIMPASPAPQNNTLLEVLAVAVIAAGAYATVRLVRGGQQQNQTNDNSKCDNIKSLLEQKEQELEDMVRGWPEEKLRAIGHDLALGELKDDERTTKAIAIAEDVRAKYDKLQDMIALLKTRFDLCTLSLPQRGKSYSGTIAEESLTDKAMLENVKIKKTYRADDWKLHEVAVNEGQIKKLGECLKDGPWFMRFSEDGSDEASIVFKEKMFTVKKSDKKTWGDVVAYGKAKGIPESRLDFK